MTIIVLLIILDMHVLDHSFIIETKLDVSVRLTVFLFLTVGSEGSKSFCKPVCLCVSCKGPFEKLRTLKFLFICLFTQYLFNAYYIPGLRE